MKYIILIAFLLVLGQGRALMAQQAMNDHGPDLNKPFYYEPPTFVDYKQFVVDMKRHLNLKRVVDTIKIMGRNRVGYYSYSFRVNKKGEIEANRYSQEDLKQYEVIDKYVKNVFNHYRWKPAYLKKNRKAKVTSFLELLFHFDAKTNYEVEISITLMGDANYKKIYGLKMPYKSLKMHQP